MKKQSGLTLIELLVVIGIFSGLMTVITGIFIANFEMQRQTMAVQKTIGEISYAMEYMGRSIRMAKNDENGTCLEEADSRGYTYGIPEEGEGIQFINYKDECIKFFREDDVIKKGVWTGTDWREYNLTSGLLDIKAFRTTSNVLPGDEDLYIDQPSVTLFLKVEETSSYWWQTRFQTTITRRKLDVERTNE